MIWSRKSNSTVKTLPLNYLAPVPFYRHVLYLWTSLKAWYAAAVFPAHLCSGSRCCWRMISLSITQSADAVGHILMSAVLEMEAALFVCLLSFHTPIKTHSKVNLGVTMTLNAMTLFPTTLSCPIVQNSPRGLTESLGGTKWERNQWLSSLHCLCPGWITETRCCT